MAYFLLLRDRREGKRGDRKKMRFADWWTKKITELNILYLREFSRHGLQPAVSPADGHLATPTADNYAQKTCKGRGCVERE